MSTSTTSAASSGAGIFKALAQIQRGIHAVGVGKVRRNQEQKFNFRGIDDALSAFAPLLTEAGVVAVPSYSDITVTDRQTKSGSTTYNVRLAGTFRFVCAEDGSETTVGPFYGEANDGQDKAISKATSVAYRNALFLTFCVPHEPAIGGDPDGQGEAGELPRVSDDQAATIQALAEEVKADIEAFLKYLTRVGKAQIASVAQIPAVMYADAVALLEQKRRAGAK